MEAEHLVKVVVTHGIVTGNAEDGTIRDHGVGDTMLMSEMSYEALKDRVRRVEGSHVFTAQVPAPQKAVVDEKRK